jgi:murein DD-endopeptidase MepM/ murein hydrolase activator NlpD
MRARAFSGLSKAVLIIAASSLGAACSSDVVRFDDSPFRSQQVASAQPREVASAPVERVESAPLPSNDVVPSGRRDAQVESSPFGQSADPGLTTGTVTQRQSFGSSNPNTPAVRQMAMGRTSGGEGPVASGRGSWSATGGTSIRAAQGDTPETLSRRYGVPSTAIAQANNISGNQPFTAGQNVIIPTYSMAAAAQPASRGSSDLVRQPAAAAPEAPRAQARPAAAAPQREAALSTPPAGGSRMTWQSGAQAAGAGNAATPARPQAARPASHTVATGETLSSLSRKYGVTRQQLATANSLQADQALRIGQTLRVPAATAAAQTRPLSVEPQQPQAAQAAQAPAPAVRREQAQRAVAQAQATPAGRRADQQPTAAIPPTQPALAAAQSEPAPAPAPAPAAASTPAPAQPAQSTATAEPQFRWPVRGRVISGFRAGSNDGIKLSVPQGTPIKAAEDGVVAYAGNELRGYGNLVLVRHSNGYVTAYAHNSAISVRRGEQVRRGQTIAEAGQTGNVASPQLHFEIRRGATPVDPMTFLGSN